MGFKFDVKQWICSHRVDPTTGVGNVFCMGTKCRNPVETKPLWINPFLKYLNTLPCMLGVWVSNEAQQGWLVILWFTTLANYILNTHFISCARFTIYTNLPSHLGCAIESTLCCMLKYLFFLSLLILSEHQGDHSKMGQRASLTAVLPFAHPSVILLVGWFVEIVGYLFARWETFYNDWLGVLCFEG